MKRLFVLFLVLICLPVKSQNFGFDFDYAVFKYDSSLAYIEIYYSFEQSSLSIQKENDSNFIEGILHIVIRDSSSSESLVDNYWSVRNTVAENDSLVGKNLIGVIAFTVPDGSYNLIISGSDAVNTSFSRSINEKFNVNTRLFNNLSMSDIQLSSKILQDSPNQQSIFYKNSLEVTPVPNAIFGVNQPVLFYYTELYNLMGENDETYKLSSLVLNSQKQVYFSKSKNFKSSVGSKVELGVVNISKYPTDSYTLILTLSDSSNNNSVTTAKRFFVYNPDVIDSTQHQYVNTELISSQFGIMSEEECDDLFEKSKYISSQKEIEQYKSFSTLEAKREFLFKFWSAKDPDATTIKNEFLIEFLARIEYANQRFSHMTKVGWKTDRGRVYIIYGEPSEIERYPNQVDTKPYEIWHYNNLEGGAIFVFGDLTGFSDLSLLHSTVRGELRDDLWQRRIKTN